MSRLLGIAVAQVRPIPGDPQASLEKLVEITESVVVNLPWVDLVCFPELFISGLNQFVDTQIGPAFKEMAQPIPGPVTDRLSALARRTKRWLQPGSLFEHDGDRLYNTAIVISPEGEIVAHYRKLYPWRPLETVSPGDRGFCVFEVPEVGRFGLCICYDMWFPEVVRTLAWMGAEVILHPSMTSTSDRTAETILARANAIFSQSYFVDVNVTGVYGGGRSQIIDPHGNVLQSAGEHETILTEVLDLDKVSHVRELGTVALSQVWKSWRDNPQVFPPYHQPMNESPLLQKLGPLRYIDDLRRLRTG
jgi:formamidase